MAFEEGQEINGYRLLTKFTTSGGGGEHAIAEKEGKRYHIKTPLSPRDNGGSSTPVFEQFLKGWKGRIDALRMIPMGGGIICPRDVFAYQVNESVRWAFIVSEYVELTLPIDNESLVRLPREQKLQYMSDAAYQMKRLHQTGIVHSDIKIMNIPPTEQVDSKGETYVVAKMLDFDSCYPVGHPPEIDDYVMDPVFAAPEVIDYLVSSGEKPEIIQKKRAKLGKPVDIFSLGVVFGFLWAGRYVGDETKRYLSDVVISADRERYLLEWLQKNSDIPPGVMALILHMLSQLPESRPTGPEVDRICKQLLLDPDSVLDDRLSHTSTSIGGKEEDGADEKSAGKGISVPEMKGLHVKTSSLSKKIKVSGKVKLPAMKGLHVEGVTDVEKPEDKKSTKCSGKGKPKLPPMKGLKNSSS